MERSVNEGLNRSPGPNMASSAVGWHYYSAFKHPFRAYCRLLGNWLTETITVEIPPLHSQLTSECNSLSVLKNGQGGVDGARHQVPKG